MEHVSLSDLLSWYLVFLFSLVCHEASHAFAAWKLGDPTAYRGGQATLNPIPHLQRSPMGTVVVPLVFFFSSGWMLGWASAPYNRRWAAAYPRRAGLMAAAGPAANLVIVLAAFAAMKAGLAAGIFAGPQYLRMSELVDATKPGSAMTAQILSIAFSLNVILCCFNLIPLPPLDGSTMVKLILPAGAIPSYDSLISRPGAAFAGLLFAWFVFPKFGGTLLWAAAGLLYPR
jgi:Zn-dependent protease